MALITAGMTAFYMTRMWMMTFSGPSSRMVSSIVSSEDHTVTGNWVLEYYRLQEFLFSQDSGLKMNFLLLFITMLSMKAFSVVCGLWH